MVCRPLQIIHCSASLIRKLLISLCCRVCVRPVLYSGVLGIYKPMVPPSAYALGILHAMLITSKLAHDWTTPALSPLSKQEILYKHTRRKQKTIYIYIYTYMCVNIYIHMYMYICMYIYVIYVYIYFSLSLSLSPSLCIYIYTYMFPARILRSRFLGSVLRAPHAARLGYILFLFCSD